MRSSNFLAPLLVLVSFSKLSLAGTEQLAMSSQIQYSRVIQGAQDPVTAFIYNNAPPGSDTGNYKVFASFTYGDTRPYVGTKIADGGANFVTLPFIFDSSKVAPSKDIPISVTGINTATNVSLTQNGSVTVLAHSTPALLIQGQIVYLNSKTVVQATTDAFSQVAPTGTELQGGFNPGMLGDPPGVPTAALDLDSVSTTGSPNITTTLHPFTNLPSDDDPAEALPFEIDIHAPTPGDYFTTFTLHYSDEDDLPGAAPPGSEAISFSVECNLTTTTAFWTITTVPEPSATSMVLAAITGIAAASRLARLRSY
jgi:hypothetical protein